MPPITTVGNGRCSSEPIPLFSATGMNPGEARSATKAQQGRGRPKQEDQTELTTLKHENERLRVEVEMPEKAAA